MDVHSDEANKCRFFVCVYICMDRASTMNHRTSISFPLFFLMYECWEEDGFALFSHFRLVMCFYLFLSFFFAFVPDEASSHRLPSVTPPT
jgi:uncharacterized membrane protein YbaN (DUF454 family)